jgi:4-hydroxy 2-oxovalerate aldolase
MSSQTAKVIVTSNIAQEDIESNQEVYRLNYNRLSSAFEQGYNSYVMLLKFLSDIGLTSVVVAGADGYMEGEENYYKSSLINTSPRGNRYNLSIRKAINRLPIAVHYLKASAYEN